MNKINDILDSLQGRQPKIKDSWDLTESILKKVEELQAAGLHDDRRDSCSTEATRVTPSQTSAQKRKISLWRWTVAAAIAIAAGLGLKVYQSQMHQHKVGNESLIGETNKSHQRDTTVSPVRQADTPGRIDQVAQSHEGIRPDESRHTIERPSTALSEKKTAASGNSHRNKEDLKQEPTTMPDEPATENQLMTQASSAHAQPETDPYFDAFASIEEEMREIHARGTQFEAVVAELTKQ